MKKLLIWIFVLVLIVSSASAIGVIDASIYSDNGENIDSSSYNVNYTLDLGYDALPVWYVNNVSSSILYLPFELNNISDIGMRNNLTYGTPLEYKTGIISDGLFLNDSIVNSQLAYSVSGLYEDNTTLTVFGWIKPEGEFFEDDSIIFGTHAIGYDGFQVYYDLGTDNLQGYIPCGPALQPINYDGLLFNMSGPSQWYFVGMKLDNGLSTVYFDDGSGLQIREYVYSATCTELYNNNAGFLLGALWNTRNVNLYGGLQLTGILDEVMLFNEAISNRNVELFLNATKENYSNNYLFEEMTDVGDVVKVCVNTYNETSLGDSMCSDSVLIQNDEISIGSDILILDTEYSENVLYNLSIITNKNSNYISCQYSMDNLYIDMDNLNSQNYSKDFDMGVGEHIIVVKCYNGSYYNKSFSVTRQSVEVTNISNYFTNSQGLDIYYDIYSPVSSEKMPLYLISDSWNLNRTYYRATAISWKSEGYFALNLETRGKGNSEGIKDASGYECLDIYETVQDALEKYPGYIDENRIYLNGLSAAGGKTLNCVGKMPDLFTAVQGVASVSNYTLWVQLNPGYKPEVENRIGYNYTNNLEAYKARNGAWTAYNTKTPILIHHGDVDVQVNVNVSRLYNHTVSSYPCSTVRYVEEVGQGHSFSTLSKSEAITWFSTYITKPSYSNSGDLRIGSFIRTELFDVDLALGRTGTVVYDFETDGEFSMVLNTDTYTGPVNITIKNTYNNLYLTDNGEYFFTLRNGNIEYSNSEYNVVLTNDDITFIIPHMSEHTIVGLLDRYNSYHVEEGINGVKVAVFAGFGLIAVALLAAIAFLITKMFNSGVDMASLTTVSIMAIGLAITLFVGYIIISAVAQGLI